MNFFLILTKFFSRLIEIFLMLQIIFIERF